MPGTDRGSTSKSRRPMLLRWPKKRLWRPRVCEATLESGVWGL